MFLIFITDLSLDLPDHSRTEIRKYVDDTKAMRGNMCPEDVLLMQDDLNSMYRWEAINHMPFNASKFMNLRMTVDKDRSLSQNTMFFTPDYGDPIQEHDVVRDLGVLLDSDGGFTSHRLLTQKKAMRKCSWIFRSFKSREPDLLKSLWKSLVQPVLDYASQVWSPVGRTGEIAWMEKPMRQYTRRMKGMTQLNYWERLSKLKMLSTERRTERYKIIYLWKTMNGLAPSLGVEAATLADSRLGFTVKIPAKSGSKESVQSMKDQFFSTHAPRLFNSLPKSIRNGSSSMTKEIFKMNVDLFLENVPDHPILAGYHSGNLSLSSRMSNSILDWVRNNPQLLDWSLDTVSD